MPAELRRKGAVMEHPRAVPRARDVGVYYRRHDLAGFWRRLAIDLVDVLLAAALMFALSAGLRFLMGGERDPGAGFFGWPVLVSVAVVGFGYFVVLKGSRFRTLGYRLLRARIVDLQGCRPNLYTLTVRLCFGVLGPLNFPLDLIWIPGDRFRQALRDKLCGTYVIRDHAEPEGHGPIVYVTNDVLGMAIVWPEVRTPERSGAP